MQNYRWYLKQQHKQQFWTLVPWCIHILLPPPFFFFFLCVRSLYTVSFSVVVVAAQLSSHLNERHKHVLTAASTAHPLVHRQSDLSLENNFWTLRQRQPRHFSPLGLLKCQGLFIRSDEELLHAALTVSTYWSGAGDFQLRLLVWLSHSDWNTVSKLLFYTSDVLACHSWPRSWVPPTNMEKDDNSMGRLGGDPVASLRLPFQAPGVGKTGSDWKSDASIDFS